MQCLPCCPWWFLLVGVVVGWFGALVGHVGGRYGEIGGRRLEFGAGCHVRQCRTSGVPDS